MSGTLARPRVVVILRVVEETAMAKGLVETTIEHLVRLEATTIEHFDPKYADPKHLSAAISKALQCVVVRKKKWSPEEMKRGDHTDRRRLEQRTLDEWIDDPKTHARRHRRRYRVVGEVPLRTAPTRQQLLQLEAILLGHGYEAQVIDQTRDHEDEATDDAGGPGSD